MSGEHDTLAAALVESLDAPALAQLAERLKPYLAAAPAADDGWLRGADAIAAYISSPRSRVYALAACTPPRIPLHRDGSALVAKRSELDAWVRDGGGKRP